MGVVRREGNWRLEKREDGVYEITYEKEPQERILTSKYEPDMVDNYGIGAIPVHRVESYSEAEGLFEERAKGRSPSNIGTGQDRTSLSGEITVPKAGSALSTSGNSGREASVDSVDGEQELPPGGIALVAAITGSVAIWTSGIQFGSVVFLAGTAFLIFGLGIVGWAFLSSETTAEGVEKLLTIEEASAKNKDSDNETEKTPPAPQTLKDDLYFERANQECEWCGEQIDQPEVHHIVPRSEGGPNDRSNLIVLCPNHHRKADAGAISRSKLKSKLRRIED